MEDNNDKILRVNLDYFKDLTDEIGTVPEKEPKGIGKKIKAIREEKGVSLVQLSNLTGFDVTLLSSIENNTFQPQLGTVMKLAKALESAFGRLVGSVGDKLYSVTRKNEQKVISRSVSRKAKKQIYAYKSLAPDVKGRHMEALLVRLEENPDDEMSVHEGEEFLYVLEGTVVIRIGEDRFELEPGDSIYYLSTTPHLVAAKQGKATILAMIYEG